MIEEYTVIDMATGEIKRCGATAYAQAHPLESGEGMYVGAALSGRDYYFVDSLPVAYTEEEREARTTRPKFAARWNVATKAWIDIRTAGQLQVELAAEIEVERDRRINADIEYGGGVFQAAARDQKNLTDTLQEMDDRLTLGTPLPDALRFWRDTANGMHVFADDDSYLAWLRGFAVAVAQRRTEAYAWSWGKKALLADLNDDLVALRGFHPQG